MPLATMSSILVALGIALFIGPLLGRFAAQWLTGQGLTSLLLEIRGAFLPFLLAPLVQHLFSLSPWAVVGVVVGLNQAISVARWITKRSGELSSAMLGQVALGRSNAALLSSTSAGRGAVVGTLAVTAVQVILLEALLTGLALPQLDLSRSVGGLLFQGAGASTLLLLVLGGGGIFVSEIAISWLLQRRGAPSRQQDIG